MWCSPVGTWWGLENPRWAVDCWTQLRDTGFYLMSSVGCPESDMDHFVAKFVHLKKFTDIWMNEANGANTFWHDEHHVSRSRSDSVAWGWIGRRIAPVSLSHHQSDTYTGAAELTSLNRERGGKMALNRCSQLENWGSDSFNIFWCILRISFIKWDPQLNYTVSPNK